MSPEPRDSGVLLGLSVALLLGLGFVTWAIGSTTTSAEVVDLLDTSGQGPTRTHWAAGPISVEHSKPAAPPLSSPRPRTEDLLAGRSCLPLAYLLSNREQPAEHSFGRDISCGVKTWNK